MDYLLFFKIFLKLVSTFMKNTDYLSKNSQDKWIDYLTAYGYDVNEVYHNLITRIRGDPRRLMQEMLTKTQNFMKISPDIRAFLENVSPYTRIQKVMEEVNKNFKLSKNHLKLLLSKYLWVNVEQEVLFDYLQSKNIKLKVRLKRGNYELVVLVTQSMQHSFTKFGDVVNVNFNFVPTKRNALMRCHYLGLFTGVNFNGDILIFGIAIIVGSNPQFRAQAIMQFLQLVKPLKPICLIGQHSEQIKTFIQNYNQINGSKISFFSNWYYTLQRAEKEYMSQPYRKQIINQLKKLLLTFNKKDIMNITKKINKCLTIKENRSIVQILLRDTMSYVSKQSPSFVGFEIQANKTYNISQIVKSEFGYCKNIGNLIYRCFQLQKKLYLSASKPKFMEKPDIFFAKYQKLQKKQELINLTKSISSEMYKKVFYNYFLAMNNCKLVQNQANPLTVTIMQESPHKKKQYNPNKPQENPSDLDQYIVKFNIISDCWQCECNMIYWAGIPCSHLMHVVLHYGGSLRYYINTRWIINKKSNQKLKNSGRNSEEELQKNQSIQQ